MQSHFTSYIENKYATLFTIVSWEEENVNREKHGQVLEEAVTETRVLFIKTTSLKSSKLCLKRQTRFFQNRRRLNE